MSFRLVSNTIITRNEATALVELTVLSYHRGRDGGYYENDAHYNDDPSEIELDPEGVVVGGSDEENFPAKPGERITLTPEELSKAEEDAFSSFSLPHACAHYR